ncbi:MAG: amino acid permease [Deltaproteobacteria bacterium]|nr:amino acid permease [Nannocystaceae bacterium]
MSEPDRWGERLPRRIGPWSAAAVVVGSTIGSGIFRTPADIAGKVESLGAFVAVWLIGAVIALCGALSYAELSAMMPRTGGIYVYLREAFGRLTAFLFGWAELLVLRPAAYGAIAVTCADYAWRLFGADGGVVVLLGLSGAQLTAAVLIVVVGVANIRAVSLGAAIQNVSTLLKMSALLALCGLGARWAFAGHATLVSAGAPQDGSPVAAFGLAMVAVMWAYDGWSDVGFVSGEVRDPQRNLPRAFVLGTLAVAVLYLGANAAYLAVIPLAQMPSSSLIAADVAATVIGQGGVAFVSAAVVVSTFGTLNGSMMTGPRVFYAMAADGLFFTALAKIDPRYGTPGRAIAMSMGLGVVFVSVRAFADLADQFVVGIWPFYALGVLAVFVLRRRDPARERPYRTWGYPWVPALFLVATLFLLGSYLVTKPVEFLACFGVIALGVPVYWAWTRKSTSPS